ncbi:MAG: T9SS type A sorting domain-containing protein [Bacteroidetes bacterium]|nr:T9SS type A sorting domain-containing protein [Bacteroidota bacterium]
MKTRQFLAFAFCLILLPLMAQPSTPASSYKTESSNCNLPTSQVILDINNVRATLLNAGDLWYDAANRYAGYEVPKAAPGQAGPNAIYAGAIWVSGFDAGNNLKMAALTYRENGGSDFYSGPLDNTGNTVLSTCDLWDRHFPVWATQIRSVISAYQNAINNGGTPGNINLPVSSFSDSVKFWPGNGNPYLTALGYDVHGPLAPFYDVDGDGVYDPAHGDYPTIMQGGISSAAFAGMCGMPDAATLAQHDAYADEMIYWAMNDKGNAHNGSNGQSIGVQVNALAFAFQTNDNINEMTFYRYHFINKSGATLGKACISQYTDPDLGCPYNDRIGCDTMRNMAFVYNGTPQSTPNTPGQSYVCDLTGSSACSNGTIGYGCVMPVLGIVMVETPSDTVTYPDINNPSVRVHRPLGMTSFFAYTAATVAGGQRADALRGFQVGVWPADTAVVWGGNGYPTTPYTLASTMFEYPGDPANANEWSMCHDPANGNNIPGYDRRMLQTSGSFTFLPCASQYMTIAVTFTDSVGSNCPGKSEFIGEADSAQNFFNSGFRRANYTGISTLLTDALHLYPNPVTSDLLISSTGKVINEIKVYDLSGRLIQTQSGSDMHSIDMSVLTEGVYMVYLRSGSQTTTQKIVKR